MKEKLLASAALVLLACTPAMAQGLDEVKHKFASVSGIVQDKCMACHSRGYDLPFYAKVPGISAIIEKDYRDGIRAMDLNQELVQRKPHQVLRYELVGQSGPDHAKVFTVAVLLNGDPVGEGSGHSKKEAEQAAAQSVANEMNDELCARLLDKLDRLEATTPKKVS